MVNIIPGTNQEKNLLMEILIMESYQENGLGMEMMGLLTL